MKITPRALGLCLMITSLLASPLPGAIAPQEIILWPEGVPGLKPDAVANVGDANGRYTNVHHPILIAFPPPAGTANGTAFIYCPGGGYVQVSMGGANGGGVTQWLNSLGITVFALIYRNDEYGAPAPLQDVLRAVRTVRSRAAEFGLNPDRIGVIGGSAGSHVAATAGTLYDDPEGKTGNPLDAVSGKPNFMILLFSVISMESPVAHGASRTGLLGNNPTPEQIQKYSLEKHVTAETPPAFLVHTQQDTTVREENTLAFYQALRNANVPSELHLYARGPHGSGMDDNLGTTSLWPKLAEEWMRFNGWIPTSPTSLLKVQTPPAGGPRGARGARGPGAAPAAAGAPAPATPAGTPPPATTPPPAAPTP